MKMGKNDPRRSMSKSVKGKPPKNRGGKNPIKSPSPYEVQGVGECCSPKGPSGQRAPQNDPIEDESSAH
jgi:hypothetical protein